MVFNRSLVLNWSENILFLINVSFDEESFSVNKKKEIYFPGNKRKIFFLQPYYELKYNSISETFKIICFDTLITRFL